MHELRTLHDPARERDACGIGFVADTAGRASRAVLDLVLAGLATALFFLLFALR